MTPMRKHRWKTPEYKQSRQALLALEEKISFETRSLLELERMGIKRSRVLKWEKEGKVKGYFLHSDLYPSH